MNQISQYFGSNRNKRDLSESDHEKVAQQAKLMKLVFFREALSHLTVEKFYLTAEDFRTKQ